ncbi:MAG TPA: copper-binding protein [Burkholderiales bacterium]|nr:copper-binding protein [Burkholderiales bacterium]
MKAFKSALVLAGLLALASPWFAHAEQAEHGGHHAASAAGEAHTGKGLVNRVNAAAGEIDLRHEPMPSLKWPAMTMTFKAHDAALLKGLKEGDRVEFDIVKMGDEFHITRIVRQD